MAQETGLVFLIDGVGGFGLAPKVLESELRSAGVPHELKEFYWSHGFGRWHADLTDVEHIRKKASELADSIMKSRCVESSRPVYFVAKSGGTAVALAALESLPNESVERAILLSPAVSSTYDLRHALRSVRRNIVSFWSPKDAVVLGMGTTLFGTADRISGAAAGLTGFRIPPQLESGDRHLYDKLEQVEWEPSMRKSWNFGTHLGTSMPLFVRNFVAPLLDGSATAP